MYSKRCVDIRDYQESPLKNYPYIVAGTAHAIVLSCSYFIWKHWPADDKKFDYENFPEFIIGVWLFMIHIGFHQLTLLGKLFEHPD